MMMIGPRDVDEGKLGVECKHTTEKISIDHAFLQQALAPTGWLTVRKEGSPTAEWRGNEEAEGAAPSTSITFEHDQTYLVSQALNLNRLLPSGQPASKAPAAAAVAVKPPCK